MQCYTTNTKNKNENESEIQQQATTKWCRHRFVNFVKSSSTNHAEFC